MLSFSQQFQAQHPGKYGVVWNTKDAYFNAPWVYGFGGYYVKPDGTVGLTSDGTKAGFNFISGFRGKIPAAVDYGVADTLFKEGKAAIIINGPWSVADYGKAKRERDWQEEVSRFYSGLEKALRHAESIHVTIALKPHTGITARAKDCIAVLKRVSSPNLKIAWDAGNVSYYEGVHPDPDLPDLAPQVKAVCLKDHLGLRGDDNFPVMGQGQVDHELMFRTLFSAGFNGPMAIERVDGRDGGMRKVSPEVVDERLTAANKYLVPLLDRVTSSG